MTTTHSPVTATDHSPLIVIAVYFLMVTFILAVAIRFAIRLGIARAVSRDDWICLAAMVVGIGQAIAVQIGVNNGLGKAESRLTQHQIADTLKAQYASSYFYVLSLGLSKVSILLLLTRLAVTRLHKRIAIYTVYFVGAWTFVAVITLGARCGAHLPWTLSASSASSQCINIKTFWAVMTSFDVLTEAVVIIVPVLMMIPVQVAVSKKLVIIFAFLFRLLPAAASITRLYFLIPHTPSTNFTFRAVNAQILTQVVLSMSITTACIPCLKPFLDAFASGQMAVTFKNGVPGTNSYGNSYPMRDLAYGNNLAYGAKGTTRSHVEVGGHDDNDEAIEAAKYGSNRSRGPNAAAQTSADDQTKKSQDSDSIASDTKSDQMIIKKNVQWTVSYEDVDADADAPEPERDGRAASALRTRDTSQIRSQGPSRGQPRLDEDSGDEADDGYGHRKGGGSVGYAV